MHATSLAALRAAAAIAKSTIITTSRTDLPILPSESMISIYDGLHTHYSSAPIEISLGIQFRYSVQ